jgi:hypothetical protein
MNKLIADRLCLEIPLIKTDMIIISPLGIFCIKLVPLKPGNKFDLGHPDVSIIR